MNTPQTAPPARMRDPVPVAPFAEWAADMEARIGKRALLERLGWLDGREDSAERRLHRIHHEQTWVERLDVLDWLHMADAPWWELYDEPDPEPVGTGRNSTYRCDVGRSYRMSEQLTMEAHAMHLDGMSYREIARELHPQTTYKSPASLANSFTALFRARGLEIRSRTEATALANRKRAYRPQCSHVPQIGPRKGERCERRCVGDDVTCWKHDPDRIAAGIARLRELTR